MEPLLFLSLPSARATLVRCFRWIYLNTCLRPRGRAHSFLCGGIAISLGAAPGSAITQLKSVEGNVFSVSSLYHLKVENKLSYRAGPENAIVTELLSAVDFHRFGAGGSMGMAQESGTLYSFRLNEKVRVSNLELGLFGGYSRRLAVALNPEQTEISVTPVGALEYGGALNLALVNGATGKSGVYMGAVRIGSAGSDFSGGFGVNFGCFFNMGAKTQVQFKPDIEFNSYDTSQGNHVQAMISLNLSLEIPTGK